MTSAEDKPTPPSEERDRLLRQLTIPESRPGALGEIILAERLLDVPPEPVTACLLDPVEATRILAIETLLKMGTRGVGGLVSTLAAAQPVAVRVSGAMALGRLGPEAGSAVEPLAACVQSEDALLRLHAGLALSRVGVEAIPHLRALLHSPNDDTARAAATALGRMGERATEALDALQSAAGESPSPYVRIACYQAITSISGSPDAGLLETLPLLDSEDPDVRRACLEAIREIGPSGDLIREKVRECLQDVVGTVRGAAVLTLARVEPDAGASVPLLLPLLTDNELDVRAHAVMALAHYGPGASEAIEPLEALKGVESPFLQAVVDAALARIRGEGSVQR
jgi:HEAT repeat protein